MANTPSAEEIMAPDFDDYWDDRDLWEAKQEDLRDRLDAEDEADAAWAAEHGDED